MRFASGRRERASLGTGARVDLGRKPTPRAPEWLIGFPLFAVVARACANDGKVDHPAALVRECARKGLNQGPDDADLIPAAETTTGAGTAPYLSKTRPGAHGPGRTVQDALVA